MTRNEQFEYIGLARERVLAWAQAQGIPLARIEFVVPFVASDFSLSVWLFYETERDRAIGESRGWFAAVEAHVLATLTQTGYSADWLGRVSFVVDSCENVERNYEGSYFYRLR